MRADSEGAKKSVSDSKTKVYGIVALCILLIYILMVALGLLKQIGQKPAKPSPPDLSSCTHLEIHCYPSIIKFFSTDFDPDFLTVAEVEYLESVEKLVIDDKKTIEAFARKVSSGSYKGVLERNMPMPPMGKSTLSIACYANDERMALITIEGPNFIVTKNGHEFDCDIALPDLLLGAPRPTKPFVLRFLCGAHLWALYEELWWVSGGAKAYPAPSGWCDILVRNRRDSDFSKEEIREVFKCPGGGKGKCHYAMNPNCEPNSPPDTVLLFETKAGWNQHGGPELFTFDNHDPKGGCVLLNDGTVKFIRTKEELEQLRWK